MFNQDWLQSFISISDTDKRLISQEEAESQMEGMRDREILEKAGVDEEHDAALDADDQEKADKILEDAKESMESDLSDEIYGELDDPIEYFVNQRGIYTVEELMKAGFIRIDTESAAKAAVREDGWAHFLSHYDGDYKQAKNGLVYWRR